ncbi:MAG: hypothetical protein AAGJ35_06020, partial [Myxococcota bacterium]
MLTDEQKQYIVESWNLIHPHVNIFCDHFYERLFVLRPNLHLVLFENVPSQKKKLIQFLSFIAQSLNWRQEQWSDKVAIDDDLLLVSLELCRHYKLSATLCAQLSESILWAMEQSLGS